MKKLLASPPTALIGTVTLVALSSAFSAPAVAIQINGFNGPYQVNNWVLNANGGDGSVNTAGAPNFITLIGSDNGSGNQNTDYTVSAINSGLVSFDWNYSSGDSDNWDGFGYLLNGTFTQLANNSSQGPGSTQFNVLTGNTFGFRVFSLDSCCGSGNATISNFSAPAPVPLETDALPVVVGAAFMAGGVWWKKKRTGARALDLSPTDMVKD